MMNSQPLSTRWIGYPTGGPAPDFVVCSRLVWSHDNSTLHRPRIKKWSSLSSKEYTGKEIAFLFFLYIKINIDRWFPLEYEMVNKVEINFKPLE
jgi:hypothetical protein